MSTTLEMPREILGAKPATIVAPTRTLVPIEAVMVLLDLNEDQVLELVEFGQMPHAWNIASPGSERRELRILRTSLIRYLASQGARTPRAVALPVAELARSVLPAPVQVEGKKGQLFSAIRSVELQRYFSCSQWLIRNLLDTGELKKCPIPVRRKESPYLEYDSAAQFLVRRFLQFKAHSYSHS